MRRIQVNETDDGKIVFLQASNGMGGSGLLHGEGPPDATIGRRGNFYLDLTNKHLYGPKSLTEWPTDYIDMAGAGCSDGGTPICGDGSITKMKAMTEIEYSALGATSPTTLYVVLPSGSNNPTDPLDPTDPVFVPGDGGPLIKNGLITNSYHDVMGRGGYFPAISGTSEGQSIGIEGSFLCYEQLTGGTPEEQAAADWYRTNGKQMLDALGDGTNASPMLRQPIPQDVETITLLHWLFAARGSSPSQAINYDFTAVGTPDNKLIIPETVPTGYEGMVHKGASDVFRVWMFYPSTADLLYYSPYSIAYLKGSTSVAYDGMDFNLDESFRLDDGLPGPIELPSPHWTYVNGQVEIGPFAAIEPGKEYYVVYAYQNAGIIEEGSAFEAYPHWGKLPDGFSACAPDTFRWFDFALNLAIEHDDRVGKASDWTKLRDASRRTVVKGQNVSDLREVLEPLPQFPVFAPRGEPSGMFCYSNHPLALSPPADIIAEGGNVDWLGFNFWGRHNGIGGTVAPNEFVWTPENMFYPAGWTGDIYNGCITLDVPSSSTAYQTQIGRGKNDYWRSGTKSYEEKDEFLFVALECSKKPDPLLNEKVEVFISTSKAYSEFSRLVADIGQYESFQAGPSTDGGPRYFLIPREGFSSIALMSDYDGTLLNPGPVYSAMLEDTLIQNFGISFEMAGPFTAKIVAMRIVGGESAAAIQADWSKHIKGAQMPYFPGALPFAINAYIPQQQFVGWNGSPFHGYQLPDLWYFLGVDANSVHPNLVASDLSTIDPITKAIQYPISATTTGGTTKPKHALLMEQQLMFLKDAQSKYEADGGIAGIFAHTFVLNTDARMNIGNPDPHTWVYINDDPNTRWTGYQCRVVDSISRIVYLTKTDAAFADCKALAKEMAVKWLTAYNTLWPNLNGVSITDESGTYLVYGAPTDFPDPKISAPQTFYEEPHAPALVLRGCVWLLASGELSATETTLVSGVAQRCYDYLLMRFNTTPDHKMQYTWHNTNRLDGTDEYFGFWHFEILTTFGYMLKHPEGVPAGIDLVTVKEMVVQSYHWLDQNVTHTIT